MKPSTITPDYAGIPAELRQLPVWLTWDFCFDEEKKKWNKVPLGSSVNPQTWTSFDSVTRRKADGIGMAFAYGFCGIDLDCCRNPHTGEIKPWARALVERFKSYVEISPSGEGLHILLHMVDDWQGRGIKRGGKGQGWEIGFYPNGRFFCATGVIYEPYHIIRDVDAIELSEFTKELEAGRLDVGPRSNGSRPAISNQEKSNGQANGKATDKFSRLMQGDWAPLGYASQSEADLALCCMLRDKLGPNPEVIAQVFRSSGLMRDKANEGAYLERTIAKAALGAPERTVISPENLQRHDMPDSILDGRLGEIYQRRMKDCPRAYAWGSLLTIAGASPYLKLAGQAIRGNLFWCSVGPVGTGKSVAFDRALHVLGVSSDDSILLTAKYGSAEGLTNELKHSGSCVRLLAPDELGNLLAKCAIEHSSFPTFLTTAFYRDQQRGGTKKEAWEIDCRLSIAGGVVEENFGDAFQAVSTLGLYDRFLFGLCPQPYNYEYYPCERAAEDVTSRIVAPEVDRDVWEVRDEWRKQEITGRVAENALRAAYICAAVDGRKKLRGSDLGPAFELAKYQAKVRDILKPNPGKNHDAQCGIAIMDWLRLRAPNGDWVKFRTVSKGIHAERYGPGVYMRSLLNLSWQGEIETDSKQKIMRLAGDVL